MDERRKHKRYQMPQGTFVILRTELDQLKNHAKMNIGEIAMVLYKSEKEEMRQIKDLSLGGVAFEGSMEAGRLHDQIELDVLMAEQGIYLHNIPYTAVPTGTRAKRRRKDSGSTIQALHFRRLDAEQKGQLKQLLSYHVGSPRG